MSNVSGGKMILNLNNSKENRNILYKNYFNMTLRSFNWWQSSGDISQGGLMYEENLYFTQKPQEARKR